MTKHSKGMSAFNDKDRRRERRRNHFAKDLRTPKNKQRVIPNKRKKWEDDDYFDSDFGDDI